MQFLVRFVEIKVKNGLTGFLICFSNKNNVKYGLTYFFIFYVILHYTSFQKNQ